MQGQITLATYQEMPDEGSDQQALSGNDQQADVGPQHVNAAIGTGRPTSNDDANIDTILGVIDGDM